MNFTQNDIQLQRNNLISSSSTNYSSFSSSGGVQTNLGFLELITNTTDNIDNGIIEKYINDGGSFGTVNGETAIYLLHTNSGATNGGFIFTHKENISGTTKNVASIDDSGVISVKAINLTNGTKNVSISVDSSGFLSVDNTMYSSGDIIAFGASQTSGGTGGGGLIQQVYSYTNLTAANDSTFSDADLINTINANASYQLLKRIKTLESGSALNITSIGLGNAVSSISKSGNTITANYANFISTGGGTISGNLAVNGNINLVGNIIQTGSNYETHAEQIYTNSNTIILRSGATNSLNTGEYVGFVAKRYDGTNDGQLVYDKDGFARVGDVGYTQKIATIEESTANNYLMKYNSSTLKLEGVNQNTLNVNNSTYFNSLSSTSFLKTNGGNTTNVNSNFILNSTNWFAPSAVGLPSDSSGYGNILTFTDDAILWKQQMLFDSNSNIYFRNQFNTSNDFSGIAFNKLYHSGNSNFLPIAGGTMTGNISFIQPVGLTFANGQYIKDDGNGGLIINGGALNQINKTYFSDKVGIGTITPISPLHINKTFSGITNQLTLENTYTAYNGMNGESIYFKGYYKHALISAFQNAQMTYGGDLQIQTYLNETTLNKGIYLRNDGYVGINTTTPNYRLDVSGDTHVSGALIIENDLTINSNVNTNNIYTGNLYSNSLFVTPDRTISNIKALQLGYSDSNNYSFLQSYQNGIAYTPIIIQRDGGNVLIGTTTDDGYKLKVAGTTYITNGFSEPSSEDGYRIKFYNNGGITNDSGIGLSGSGYGNETMWFNSKNGFGFYCGTNGKVININTNGNVSIGSNVNDSYKLKVGGQIFSSIGVVVSDEINGMSALYQDGVYCSDGVNLKYYNGSSITNGLTLKAYTGNVLIGTTTDISGGHKLQVGGNLNVNGQIRISDNATNAESLYIFYDHTNHYSAIQSVHENVANTNLILNKDGGNVLIGTNSDNGKKFQVNGESYFSESINTDIMLHAKIGIDVYDANPNTGLSAQIQNGQLYDTNEIGLYINNGNSLIVGAYGDDGHSNITHVSFADNSIIYDLQTNNLFLNKNTIVSGNLFASGDVTAYQTSDINLKENIKPITNGLEIINKLNPVSYNWNEKAKELNSNKTDKTDVGLIAQELENILPELVHGIYNDEYKSIDYIKLIPYLIGSIQELTKEINELKNNK